MSRDTYDLQISTYDKDLSHIDTFELASYYFLSNHGVNRSSSLWSWCSLSPNCRVSMNILAATNCYFMLSTKLTLSFYSIVIIHALNGDATECWTNPELKAFWPKDLLPSDIPEARAV